MDLGPMVFVFLVLGLHLKMVSTDGLAEDPPLDSKGREFIFAIPEIGEVSSPIPIVKVTSESHGVTEISVEQPAFKRFYKQNISYGEVASFHLTSEAVATRGGFFDGAVVVTASQDVRVSCIVDTLMGNLADGFLAIPVDALDKEYYIVTYNTGKTSFELGHLSEFIITATQNNTLVSVELQTAATFDNRLYLAGETIEFELCWSQSAQIQSSGDLTGSKVTASQAVALVAGNVCSDTLLVYRYCSYLVEQLPPVSTWGNSFVLAHMGGSLHVAYVWRILAPFPDTTLTFTDNHVTRVTVYDPKWYDYQLETRKIVMLTSDRAVMVVQFIASGKSSASVLTVPTEQFTAGAIAARATGSGFNEYTLVYCCAEESSLLVNERPLGPLKDSERLQEETYCAVTLSDEFRQDVWTVKTTDTGNHLSLQIQHLKSSKILSAFPAGMMLNRQSSMVFADDDVAGHPSTGVDTDFTATPAGMLSKHQRAMVSAESKVAGQSSDATTPSAASGAHETSKHQQFGPTSGGVFRSTVATDTGSGVQSLTGINIIILGVCGTLAVVLIPSLMCHVIACVRRKRQRCNIKVPERAVRFSVSPPLIDVPEAPNPSEGSGGGTASELLIYESVANDIPIEHSYCTTAQDKTLQTRGYPTVDSNRYSTLSLSDGVQQTYYNAGN